METGLKNRVALIAGASQGMGRAAALALAAEGVHLALCARRPEPLQQLAAQIEKSHRVGVLPLACDVRDSAALQTFVADAARQFDRIDICVANAGGPPPKQFLETTDEDWHSAFDLNLFSAVVLARAVIPLMQKQCWGRFLTISSIAVREPQPNLVLSNAVRTGILGLVRTIANDFGKDGILANNVAPGYIATDRTRQLLAERALKSGETAEQITKGWTDHIPLDRLGRPEEIADTIVWLASERASYITGQTILVDGGMYKGL